MYDRHVRDQLQQACERGQEQLIATDYLAAATTLTAAEVTAWDAEDFDTLARLYMPLQEARRQIRLRAGEGIVAMVAGQHLSADQVLDHHPHGQLLVVHPALATAVRRHAADRRLYVEVLIADQTPNGIVLLPDPHLAADDPRAISIIPADWPSTPRGTPASFAKVCALWDRLHAPFLAHADAEPDPLRRIAQYRRTIEVDPGCEFAHQRLSATAQNLARQLARRRHA